MQATNPYAPPEALVGDVRTRSEQFQDVRPFSAKGRIGRMRYLAYTFGAYLLIIAVAAVASQLLGKFGDFLGFLVALAYGIFMILLTIQRSHDMNWSGWTCLIALIPFVGLVWIFKSGTEGENDYGPPTPPNTLGVKILGLGFPVLVIVAIIGIIAAVALPAYQSYTQRAKAAQQVQTPPAQAPAAQ